MAHDSAPMDAPSSTDAVYTDQSTTGSASYAVPVAEQRYPAGTHATPRARIDAAVAAVSQYSEHHQFTNSAVIQQMLGEQLGPDAAAFQRDIWLLIAAVDDGYAAYVATNALDPTA